MTILTDNRLKFKVQCSFLSNLILPWRVMSRNQTITFLERSTSVIATDLSKAKKTLTVEDRKKETGQIGTNKVKF
jgi:hypothetical protein